MLEYISSYPPLLTDANASKGVTPKKRCAYTQTVAMLFQATPLQVLEVLNYELIMHRRTGSLCVAGEGEGRSSPNLLCTAAQFIIKTPKYNDSR